MKPISAIFIETDFAYLCVEVNNYLQMLVFEEGDSFYFLEKNPNRDSIIFDSNKYKIWLNLLSTSLQKYPPA